MACDPQGADNVARIGIQLVNKNEYAYTPGNEGGVFNADGNYYIELRTETDEPETVENNVYVRNTEESAAWTEIADDTQDLYVDTNQMNYEDAGDNRKHFIIRFKLLDDATEGEWYLHGYVKDADGNMPHENHYGNQLGWFINVESDPEEDPGTGDEPGSGGDPGSGDGEEPGSGEEPDSGDDPTPTNKPTWI